MHHNGRLFEMPLSQQIDCSDFSVCPNLRKNQTVGWQDWDCFAPSFFWTHRPLSHRRGFEAPQSQQLWASLLHKQVTAHCGIFCVRWPIRADTCWSHDNGCWVSSVQCFFSVDRWVRRKVAEFRAALGWRILLFDNCWSVSPEFRVLLHAHSAQEPFLCFVPLLLYSHTVLLHLWLSSDLVQWI